MPLPEISTHGLALYGAVAGTLGAIAALAKAYGVIRDRARLVVRRAHGTLPPRVRSALFPALMNAKAPAEVIRVYSLRVTNHGRRPIVIDDVNVWFATAFGGTAPGRLLYALLGDQLEPVQENPVSNSPRQVILKEDSPTAWYFFSIPEAVRPRILSAEVVDGFRRTHSRVLNPAFPILSALMMLRMLTDMVVRIDLSSWHARRREGLLTEAAWSMRLSRLPANPGSNVLQFRTGWFSVVRVVPTAPVKELWKRWGLEDSGTAERA